MYLIRVRYIYINDSFPKWKTIKLGAPMRFFFLSLYHPDLSLFLVYSLIAFYQILLLIH